MDRRGRACFGMLLMAMLVAGSIIVAGCPQADAQPNTGSGQGDGFTVAYTDSETDGWGILQITLTQTLPDGTVRITVDGNSSAPMTQSQIAEKILVPRLAAGMHTITLDCGTFSSSAQMEVVSFVPVESVELDRTSASMNVGDVLTLKATVTPADATENEVTWSTSDPSVATVDDGEITAVSEGTATITASCGGMSAGCTVTVKEAQHIVPVTGITLDRTSATMDVGDVLTLKATVAPADATENEVTWSTSDPSVATVDGGKVTAVSKGTATITASCGGFTAECTVTVKEVEHIIPVTGITLDRTNAQMNVGDILTLKATVAPADATYPNVTWSTSDSSVATVNGGEVTAISGGTATITASCGGFSARCTVTVASDTEVKSVTIDSTRLSLDVGAESTVRATVSPDVPGVEYVWSVGDGTGSVSLKDNGDGSATVKAEAAGTVTLTVTVKGTSVSASCEIVISSEKTDDASGDSNALLIGIAALAVIVIVAAVLVMRGRDRS